MAITSFFNTMLGTLKIEETPQFIRISGIKPEHITDAITAIWKSSKVTDNMIRTGRYEFAVLKFLLPDFLYVLETMAKEKYLKISRRLLLELIEKLKRETWLNSVYYKQHDHIVDFSQLNKFKFTPLKHQRAYMEFYNDIVPKYNLRGHYLSTEPGGGKTLNSLFLMECLKMDTIVCIVPKNSLERVWQATITDCFKDPVSYWVSSQMKPLRKGCRYYVFHYEQLSTAVEWFKENRQGLGKVGIIVDESHSFNEIKSMRTQKLIELVGPTCLNASHTLMMSGTPIKAMATECVPLLKMIDPFFNQKAQDTFLAIYGKSTIRALDILSKRLGYLMYQVKKEDFAKALEIERYTIHVPLKNGEEYTLDSVRAKMRLFVKERMEYYKENRIRYNEMYERGLSVYEHYLFNRGSGKEKEDYMTYKRYINVIRKGFDPYTMKTESTFCNSFEKNNIMPHLEGQVKKDFQKAKSVYKYVELTILGEALGSVLAKIREQCNIDIALNIENVYHVNNATNEKHLVSITDLINNAEKKTIFFTNFVGVVNALAERLRTLGFKPLVVYGNTNKDLANIVKEFGANKDANPLIATFQSLSTAVPLIMANNVVMLNNPWRPHDYLQAESRAARLGQDTTVHVTDVFLDTKGVPNVSTRSKEVLDWASENVAAMLGVKVDLEDTAGLESHGSGFTMMQLIDSNEDLSEAMMEYAYSFESLDSPLINRNKVVEQSITKGKKAYLSW